MGEEAGYSDAQVPEAPLLPLPQLSFENGTIRGLRTGVRRAVGRFTRSLAARPWPLVPQQREEQGISAGVLAVGSPCTLFLPPGAADQDPGLGLCLWLLRRTRGENWARGHLAAPSPPGPWDTTPKEPTNAPLKVPEARVQGCQAAGSLEEKSESVRI